ncbi:OPT superfamily oligopeptide transporter [Neoconidiobolus thromboides FSU 785]|nr:OPT superfamily oligopeptide transporter [Neoconidiobolus thromboides FSU 785]
MSPNEKDFDLDKDIEKYSIKQDAPSIASDDYHNFPDDGIDTQFTWRGVIVGSLLGCIVAASNQYLGLKSGWTFGSALFGAILGFAIIKSMEKLPSYLGGGKFGMKENCTVQTAATASGGLSAGFVAGVPAMFRLGLLPPLSECWGMFFLWTFAAAFFGLFYAIPLRRYFVIQQNLVFPSCTAAALTIRSLHTDGSSDAMVQAKWILWSFVVSTIYKAVSYFVPFIVGLHPLYWISTATNSQVLFDIDVTWGWCLQLTTAFFGAGMMVGMNTAISFFFGDLLAWGIIGPALFYSDVPDVMHDKPFGNSKDGTRVQFWMLWIGIVIMICASFTELLMQYKSLWNSIKGGFIQLNNLLARITPLKRIEFEGISNDDPVPEDEQIVTWMWVVGLLLSFIMTILVCYFYFGMGVGAGVLAGILGFVFSFIGCQSSGETDINPTGVIGKASQFVFAAIPAPTIQIAQTHNLIAGNISSACASQAVDMVGDLKTGHLLKASPKSQFYAQLVGTVFGIIVGVVLFMVFATAYPCILDDTITKCEFPAPAVAAWQGVAVALTDDIGKHVPPSCRIACLVFGLLTIITTILKNTILKKYAQYIPNWNAIGVAFVNKDANIPLANLIGALIAFTWNKVNPTQWKLIGIALASGLIAGEGIGGVIQAIFNIAKLDQTIYATGFACPDNDPTSC